ncbi:MAG: Rod shape-determining protein RodA, partial [uncultured Gemmatimonadetes bacterium]
EALSCRAPGRPGPLLAGGGAVSVRHRHDLQRGDGGRTRHPRRGHVEAATDVVQPGHAHPVHDPEGADRVAGVGRAAGVRVRAGAADGGAGVRQRRHHRREHQELDPHRARGPSAVGDGQDRHGAHAGARAGRMARAAEDAVAAVEAHRRGGPAHGAGDAAAGPGLGAGLRGDPGVVAVLGGHPAGHHLLPGEPAAQPVPFHQRMGVGRVHRPAAGHALLPQRVPVGEGFHLRGERGGGRGGAAAVERAEALSEEPLPGVHRPQHRPAGERLQPHPEPGGHRQRRVVRQGIPGGAAEAAGLPSRAAHRLHLFRHRRGAGLRRRDGGADHLRPDLLAADPHRRALARSLRLAGAHRPAGKLVHPRADQRGDDGGRNARHRHSAALHQLRRLVPPGEPAGHGHHPTNRRRKGAL